MLDWHRECAYINIWLMCEYDAVVDGMCMAVRKRRNSS